MHEKILPEKTTIQQKLSLVRKYLFEIVLIILCYSVYFLFNETSILNNKINDYFVKDKTEMLRTIDNNTKALELFTLKLDK